MGREVAILLLLGSLYLRICCTSTLNRSTIDESSLLAIKKHINSEILANNWSQETSFCTWIGITYSQSHPRVINLNLSNMDLRGRIATDIGNLSFLTSLDISSNSLSSSIPAEIGQLRRLRVLDMALNEFSGHIPQSLGTLGRLEWLNLRNNYLSGDISTSLSTCVHLSTLDLSYNNLTGTFPLWFGNLSQLRQLMLMSNHLAGGLPSTIFNISSLIHLDASENRFSGSLPNHIPARHLEDLLLHSNQFEGEIPSSALMHCHSLQKLSLGFNKLEGSIPAELWNLTQIRLVSLLRNELKGMIPPSVANLSNLEIFRAGYNSFQGAIPQEMGQLSRLTFLGLATNKLNGEVPQSIFNISGLEQLRLGYNNLSGRIPSSIDTSLPKLKHFDLADNHFHGRIPISVSNLSSLVLFEIHGNSFHGNVPINFGNLRQLKWLILFENHLTNNLSNPEQDFLSSLTSCKYLTHILITGNPITGVIPKSLGSTNLSASLHLFYAGSCRILSPLPNELGNLTSLLELRLEHNDLTGIIPTTLVHLNNVQLLNIKGNKMNGSITHVLCNLTKLYAVDFSENYFSGKIPECLGDLPLLRGINLASNAFSSDIPSSLWLSGQIERMNLSNNFISGSLPQEVGYAKSLIELDLSGNQLSGKIPDTISKLQNLVNLSLSNNKLDGPLSASLSELKGLVYLDLPRNNLSGPIPKPLEELTYLKYFNVSFNKLSGEIPDEGAFANFTSDSFLCGAPRFKVNECKRRPPRKTQHLKYILPAIVSLVLVAAFIWFLTMRRNRYVNPSPSDAPPTLEHRRISYYEILHATANLSEENLIGRGSSASVYKGCFGGSMVAAVKVFDSCVQRALASFDTECQILSIIRHRNLIKVITSCSNHDFKALVLAFMPNGNLGKWLYSDDCSFNIFQILEVMVDVAAALEYLHDGYSFPVVHCDLKPQNVLLDENMVAHVGDFGIAKLLTQEQRVNQTTTLGTIGYMAPEYGSEGLVSTMVDVYSYGILLMEICSRRKPTDEMFSGELTMRKWMQELFPNHVMHVVDNELVNMDVGGRRVEYGRCFTSIVELALECTKDMPEERPSMKNVLERMKKIKSNLWQGN